MASDSGASSSNIEQSSGNFELVKELVAAQLKKEGIQLWLEPYTEEITGEVGQFPLDLVERYSSLFQISADVVASTLENLRENAVRKLAANRKFKASGVATIKLKLIGKSSGSTRDSTLETGLNVDRQTLYRKVSEKFGLPENHGDVRLICNGKLLADGMSLEDQGVRNNSVVMVMISSEKKGKRSQQEVESSSVSRTRHAASVLANKKRGGEGPFEDYFFEISDQNGKPLTLPDAERKSLVLAMTLHEQGRRVAEKRQYAEALPLLLGADEEFRQCRSEVLNAVDNYAILCLDIVWCYLQLKSIKDLPNAEEMLKNCEACLKKSYGENLERLISLTGSSTKEKVLYVRLNLLQAICAFHKAETTRASHLLNKVEKEIDSLKVDDATLSQMISMGFGASESRLALRSCNGDITMAVGYISRKREENEKQLKERREKRKQQKFARKLGKTAKGEWVSVDIYNNLREMGYPHHIAKEALCQANNDMDAALQMLNESPELLRFASRGSSLEVSDDLIVQVTSMGFDVDISRSVLKHYGDVTKAIERLLETGGSLPPECQQTDTTVQHPSNLDGPSHSMSDSDDDSEEIQNALKEVSQAFKAESEESHLDLTLEEEASFLSEYRAMILTRSQMEKRL
ncbi:NEDD8 ultimate buster 1-like [Dendronephthya gigantea]|uniref:NEDD8 ultimate buster 1-like n=1 Tax=Dendronephthya gigantea TaxID=151771 RepID=UPI00106DB327|nr:NEDD8 ultimate buster 1-like [Dendronephthya gigantea]